MLHNTIYASKKELLKINFDRLSVDKPTNIITSSCILIKAGNSNKKMFPLSVNVFSHSGSSGKILNKIF